MSCLGRQVLVCPVTRVSGAKGCPWCICVVVVVFVVVWCPVLSDMCVLAVVVHGLGAMPCPIVRVYVGVIELLNLVMKLCSGVEMFKSRNVDVVVGLIVGVVIVLLLVLLVLGL